MIIGLWLCAAMGSLGASMLLIALFGKNSSNTADDRMSSAFFASVGGLFLGMAAILFIILTAMKAWGS